MDANTTNNKLEKETFHNKEHIQQARNQHKSKIKQAIDLIEGSNLDWKQKQKEYDRLSKIKFAYFKKSNAQLELEKSMAKVKQVMEAESLNG